MNDHSKEAQPREAHPHPRPTVALCSASVASALGGANGCPVFVVPHIVFVGTPCIVIIILFVHISAYLCMF